MRHGGGWRQPICRFLGQLADQRRPPVCLHALCRQELRHKGLQVPACHRGESRAACWRRRLSFLKRGRKVPCQRGISSPFTVLSVLLSARHATAGQRAAAGAAAALDAAQGAVPSTIEHLRRRLAASSKFHADRWRLVLESLRRTSRQSGAADSSKATPNVSRSGVIGGLVSKWAARRGRRSKRVSRAAAKALSCRL